MPGSIRIDWPTFWGALAFLVVGGGFALFGGYHVWTTGQFLLGAEPVSAVVMDENEDCDDDGCTWWPELSFVDETGETVVMRTRVGSSDYGWPSGMRVDALYNPSYPYLRMPGAFNLWLLGGGFLALGSFVAACGAWLMAKLVFSRRHSAD
jgi:hypothetical protein